MTQMVLREDKDGLATLILNRPEKLNSLSIGLFQELLAHVEEIAQSASISCVLLRGAGRGFCAGNDLNDIEAGKTPPRPNFQSHVVAALADLPQPLIAAVHGACFTGGLELALAADIILASANAKFGDTHGKFALTPVWGMSQRLPRRIGRAKAAEMMFTCAAYSGAEAEAMGLANKCFPDAEFDAGVEAFARSITANSPFTLRANKRLLRRTDGMSLDEGLAYEVFNTEGVGPDMQARIAAFTQKKK
ncbi:MAG: enoyl-CoA hydratase/isomerase family protein [Hyphomonadaceae bacterium]